MIFVKIEEVKMIKTITEKELQDIIVLNLRALSVKIPPPRRSLYRRFLKVVNTELLSSLLNKNLLLCRRFKLS